MARPLLAMRNVGAELDTLVPKLLSPEKKEVKPVALIGRLDLTVPDLLQILSLCMKTGKLRLSRLKDYGEIGFKKGKVIYATSSTTRNALGEILIIRKQLTEKSLTAALELQHLSAQNKRLGAILIEEGLVTPAALQDAVQHQIELVILEFLHWDTGFFRFEMADVFTDDDIMLDAQEFLVKVGISPEHLLLEGMRHEDERRKAEQPIPPSPEIAPRPAAHVPGVSKHNQPTAEIAPTPIPKQPPAGRVKEVRETEKPAPSGPKAAPPPAPEQPLAGRTKGPRGDEQRASSVPTATPPPAPDQPSPGWLEKGRESEKRPSSVPETIVPPTSDLPPEWLEEALEDLKHEASSPEITGPPAPEPSPAGRLEEAPAAARVTPSTPTATPPPASHPRPAEVPKAPPAGHDEDPVLASGPASRTTPEAPQAELSASNIVEHVLYGLPVAPWLPIMLVAPTIVTRAVVLFAREGLISGYDQYGVYGGIEGGDARVRSINIPLNEASIFAGVLNRGTTYRGKMGPGKWNAYFLEQIGGKKPNDAVLIPVIAAGKAIGIFYGDDAGSGNSLGDIERLEALIAETFSAIELPILERQSKHPA